MTDKQFEIFLSAYFADINKLQGLILSEKDLFIYFELEKEEIYWWGKKRFKISVFDILKMSIDAWFDLRDKTRLTNYENINPKIIYKKFENSLNLLIEKFPKFAKKRIEYHKFIHLFLYIDDGKYIDDEDFEEYVDKGYKKIDLELINFAVNRNENKVKKLLEKGANPMIDPLDKIFDSLILDLLATHDSTNFIWYSGSFRHFVENQYSYFNKINAKQMLTELYATSSSSKIYNIIKGFKK